MLITTFNQSLKKTHLMPKIQPTFLEILIKLTLLQTTHTLFL